MPFGNSDWSSDRNKNRNNNNYNNNNRNTDNNNYYNNYYNDYNNYNDNENRNGIRHRTNTGGLMAGGGSDRSDSRNGFDIGGGGGNDLYDEYMSKMKQSNIRNDYVDTSNISTDTPINDRKKPPTKSITSTVNMDLFHSPGSRSINKLKSLNSNDNTPTRRREYDRSLLYSSGDNRSTVSNTIHTPNGRYGGMSPMDSYQQQQQQHHHHQQQQHFRHHESNNNITEKTYDYWVLVSGLNSNDNQSVSSLLVYFQKYGDICEYLVGKGNWVFLRFTTTSSANQALSANHDIVNNNFIIVEELNPQLAHKLSVMFDASGKLVATYNQASSNNLISNSRNTPSNNLASQSEGEGLFDRNTFQNKAYKDFMSPVNYLPKDGGPFHMSTMSPNRYLQPPVKKKDCCRWIMEIFGLNY